MSKLIFELSANGRRTAPLPTLDVENYELPKKYLNRNKLPLPEVSEIQLVRHFTGLSRKSFGVDNGFYPLGSCTMKYNPKLNEDAASLEGFSGIHPLQPENTVQGALEVNHKCAKYLCKITGMDTVTLQPAAGAQGEFTALAMIKSYFKNKGDLKRTKVIIPDSAHGTNPASASMCGFTVVTVPSNEKGNVDVEILKTMLGDDVAALMLTNPNTLGVFEKDIEEIAKLSHDVGALLYYDGANMNAIMGVVRPGDMGFDVMHLNLHKTFSTPHGGGGPGCGAVGCKAFLSEYLPEFVKGTDGFKAIVPDKSIGKVMGFHGNFLVYLRALAYIMALGHDGLKETTENAVLNANFLMEKMREKFPPSFEAPCMHEFVISLEDLKDKTGVSALVIAKNLLDNGIHPPTMYFPMIVHEALMFEPTETETRETLIEVANIMIKLHESAVNAPEKMMDAPFSMPIKRLDEVKAARTPILKYCSSQFENF